VILAACALPFVLFIALAVAAVATGVLRDAFVGIFDAVVTTTAKPVELPANDPLVQAVPAWPTPTVRAQMSGIQADGVPDGVPAGVPDGVQGRLRARDCIDIPSNCVFLTTEGTTPADGAHLYFWDAVRGQLSEMVLPGRVGPNPAIVLGASGEPQVLLAIEDPWPSSLLGSLRRAWDRRGDPAGPASNSLALLSPNDPTGIHSLGPGHLPAVSPDRGKVAFIRSKQNSGYHSLHLWSAASNTVSDILTLEECDPGSGISFNLRWSPDSRMVLISGCMITNPHAAVDRKVTRQPILYDTDRRRLYLLPAALNEDAN